MDKEQITLRAKELESAMHTMKHTSLILGDDSGLKVSEKHFLWLLATFNNGDPIMPSRVAKKLNITVAAITHRINSLEEQGYVVRSSSPDDRRIVLVSLTDKGKKMAKVLRKSYWKKMCGLVENLGDKDSANLIRLISKISDYLKNSAV